MPANPCQFRERVPEPEPVLTFGHGLFRPHVASYAVLPVGSEERRFEMGASVKMSLRSKEGQNWRRGGKVRTGTEGGLSINLKEVRDE